MAQDIQWKIGGEAGFGIMTTGLLFAKACLRGGLNTFNYTEYPSLIRGGHNCMQVRVSDEEIHSQTKQVNILVALNMNGVTRHTEELADGAAIIYDSEDLTLDEKEYEKYDLIGMPWKQIIKDNDLKEVMKNNIALGASLGLLNYDLETLFGVIQDTFGRKGDEVVNANKKAAKAGYDYVQEHYKELCKITLQKTDNEPKMLINGAEAISIGAIAGGLQFYAAYPMTPSSGILHYLAKEGPKVGMVVKHAEDEISVANMAVGAGYAGARSMCGTAGGGFCLMAETVGLAGLTETPVVMFNVMRPGPATGLPTWTGQADIPLVRGAGQDDVTKIILSIGDMQDSFELTWKALNYAEKYQLPVIVMSDKYLTESHIGTAKFDTGSVVVDRGLLLSDEQAAKEEDYKRYKLTDTGISPRAIPGQKGTPFAANSDEHDEYGQSDEEIENAIAQKDKRLKKLEEYKKEMPTVQMFGKDDADLTVITWGSTKMPAREALKWLEKDGINIQIMQIVSIHPFPSEQVSEVISKAKETLIIEGNQTAQMAALIREHTGIELKNKFLRYDGRPFYPEDIVAKVKEMVN